MELVQFVCKRGGVVGTAQLGKAGFSRTELSKALQHRRLTLIRRGVYAVDKPDRAILAAVQANAKLTCVSASRFYGLWQLREPGTPEESGALHLSCGNGIPKANVVDHATCRHRAHPYLPVAGLADVLLHALRCLPEFEALVMVQSAVSQGNITVEFLRRKLPREPQWRRPRGAGPCDSAGGFLDGGPGPHPFHPGGPQGPHACPGAGRGARSTA